MSNYLRMADSANANAPDPGNVQAVAGYVNGHWPSYGGLVERFYPHKHIFSITVNAYGTAACLDIETGDATPSEAGGWVRRMLAQNVYRPCLYANASTMPAVHASLAGIPREHYRLWVAEWDGRPEVPAGYDAKQYRNDTGGWDFSVCVPDFFPERRKSPAPRRRKRRKTDVHPKVGAAGLASGLVTAVLAVLHAHGLIHLTPADTSAVSGAAALLAGYFTPGRG